MIVAPSHNCSKKAMVCSFRLFGLSWFILGCLHSFVPHRQSNIFVQSLAMPSVRGRVVVVGSANQDLTTYTGTLPGIGATVLGEHFETSCGGKGANQARAAASLRMAPVTMVCRVGGPKLANGQEPCADVFGENLLKELEKTGVNIDRKTSIVPDQSTGVAAITVDTQSGDNMIIVTPGANHAMSPADVENSLKQIANDSSQQIPLAIVIVQLEIKPEAALQALKTGKELGAITILNPAPAPKDFSLDEFLPFVDILIPNESELRQISGVADDSKQDEAEMAAQLFQKGVGQALVVTLGARGALTVQRGSSDEQQLDTAMVDAPDDLPARSLPVKDTVGAGDGFCGALATYLALGLSLTDAAGKACGVASMSVRRQGASYPTWEELPDTLKINSSPMFGDAVGSKLRITFVTGNKNKLLEVQQILGSDLQSKYEITSRKIDLPELQGDPYEIVREKCNIAAKEIDGPCIVEDTALSFNALGGMPGPYIKWFLDSCGHEGLNAMLNGFADKSAFAQTIVAFTNGSGEEVHIFDGRTDGTIVPPRGSLDFGWDPIFEPLEGNGKTYAEMSKEDKNAISHRGRSFAKLKAFLIEK